MASDRWNDHEPSTAPTDKAKSNGINPSSFYKKLHNNEQLTPTERQLGNLLQLAAHNEVVHKRSDYTAVQKMQRSAYHHVTSYKTFPLQDLAMDYLFSMMKEYLGGSKLPSQSGRPSQHEDSTDIVKNNESCASDDDPQGSSLNNCKRRKVRQHSDGMNGLIENYTAKFLAEKYHSPPAENGKNLEIEKLNDNDGKCCFLPELWSMEPRIFALETSSSGKRKYIVGQLGRFLQHYWRESNPRSRHYYELIPELTPCRLYFDLEFCKKANPHITSDESEVLMKEFIQELCCEIQLIHAIRIDISGIVDLDSSTDKKFSRHLIIHLPNGELFADACSAGVFVKRFVGRLAEEISTGALAVRRAILAKHLFVNSQAPKTTVSRSLDSKETTEHTTSSQKNDIENKKCTCFVDLGVYTRNRLFRLMGATKFGKDASAALRIASANKFQFPTDFDNSNFYLMDQTPCDTTSPRSSTDGTYNTDPTCKQQRQHSSMSRDHDAFCAALDWEMHARALAMTLVVPANASKTNVLVLTETNDCQDSSKVSVSGVARRHKSSSRSCNGDSPIPKLDTFILELSKRGGIQGKIRAWSMECLSNKGKSDSYYMSYQMSDNRWCENIGRAHRSNNIIWNIDLTWQTYSQTCHDPECRAANFRGRTIHLPEEVATDVSDYLLDQELAQLDEDRIIREANNPDLGFSDAEFDEALGDLDMTLFTPRSGNAK